MKRVIFICCFLFLPVLTFSQLVVSQSSDEVSLVNSLGVKALFTAVDLPFDSVLQRDFVADYDRSFLPDVDRVVWLRFRVVNRDSFNGNYYFYSWDADYRLYLFRDKGWEVLRNGYLVNLVDRDNKDDVYFLHFWLRPFEVQTVYVRLASGSYNRSFRHPDIFSELSYYEQLDEQMAFNQPGVTFTLVYLSGLFMIMFFTLIIYLYINEPIYLYYILYLVFQIVYSLLIFARTPLNFMNIALYVPVVGYASVEGIQFVFVGFYVFFILKLLDVFRFDRLLGRVMRGFGWACFGYAFFSILLNSLFPSPDVIDGVFIVVRFIVLPINLLLIVWVLIRVKHALIPYFIIGNVFFFAGSLLSVYVSYKNLHFDPESIFYFGNSLNVIFQMGLLGEVLCFSFAIAHHVRLIQIEKQESSNAFIVQLKQNQEIQENMNRELDSKVNEKTDELIKVYSEIEKRREKAIEEEFSHKLKEMEMLALQSQMNPHFIFNSLNSIKHLIMTDRQEDAILFLDDFSSLLRAVLQNSKRDNVTVEDELDVLELYLSLEKGRLGEGFNYEIEVADRYALSEYAIPALLLQPFVENAIWHGLMPSSKKKKILNLRFILEDTLTIIVEDNGIGRKASLALRSSDSGFHKSYGIKISQDRLALFNHLNDQKIRIQVVDLIENELALGTRVVFTYQI